MSYKQKNPSADRNQRPILDVLLKLLDRSTTNLRLLEISSGTGQHCAYFADNFPNITFQPSEYDRTTLRSIQTYAAECKYRNVLNPCVIDITKDFREWNPVFEEHSFDYILNINMIHITPWQCTEGLFYNAAKLLKSRGLLITYGPYSIDGVLVPDSNIRFNEMLQSQNPEWGVRDVRDLRLIGDQNGLEFKQIYDMPANNKILIWQKSS